MSSVSIPSEYRSELSDDDFESEKDEDILRKKTLPKKEHILDSNQKGTNDTDKNSKSDSECLMRKSTVIQQIFKDNQK